MELPSPAELKTRLPLSEEARRFVAASRQTIQRIFERRDPRLLSIVGPCSIHDPASALEYAQRLKRLAGEIGQAFFPIMRFFIEKARTRLGWKGLLYDPRLDGSCEIAEGLELSRQLLVKITEAGVPCAVELLDPMVPLFFDDLIAWGVIGARTSASQPHRQMASGMPFPVGFKNDVYGQLDVAISGILVAKSPQSHLSIDARGKLAAVRTNGNPFPHLVLRGSDSRPNYDALSVAKAVEDLQQQNAEPRLIIDCSHGNSGKNPLKQKISLETAIDQVREGSPAIAGFMIESHLVPGCQPLQENPAFLRYGVSVTDPCLGWEETESLLAAAAERSMPIHSVQS